MIGQADMAPEEHAKPAKTLKPFSPIRLFYWSVRRELWESRSLYIAPLGVAGVVLFGFLISALHLPKTIRLVTVMDPADRYTHLAEIYHIAAAAIILISFIVGLFYCLGALHSERRDRSILFWKSLPVSDLMTVLSKASIPLVVLPMIDLAIILVVQSVMLLFSTFVLQLSGVRAAPLWDDIPWLQIYVVTIYGLITASLWYAPIYAWLLFVSAWAKHATFLWAVLPPLALCLMELIAFNTSKFASLLSYRFVGFYGQAFDHTPKGNRPIDQLPHIDAAGFFGSFALWIGLGAAAAFLAAAIWLRRYREPI